MLLAIAAILFSGEPLHFAETRAAQFLSKHRSHLPHGRLRSRCFALH